MFLQEFNFASDLYEHEQTKVNEWTEFLCDTKVKGY